MKARAARVQYSTSSRACRANEVERLALVATLLGVRQVRGSASQRAGSPRSPQPRQRAARASSAASSLPQLPGVKPRKKAKKSRKASSSTRPRVAVGTRPRAVGTRRSSARVPARNAQGRFLPSRGGSRPRALPAGKGSRSKALPGRRVALQLPPGGEGGSAKPVLLLPPGPASGPQEIVSTVEPLELQPSEPKKKPRSRKSRAKR